MINTMNKNDDIKRCVAEALLKNTGKNFHCSINKNCVYCMSDGRVFIFNQNLFLCPHQPFVQMKIDRMLQRNQDIIDYQDSYYFDDHENLIRMNKAP